MNPIGSALKRPYTVMVAVAGIVLGSLMAVSRMPIDIFPNLNLSVIYVIQVYEGMVLAEMERLLTN
jgi:multidrug efflux pump subunit AcrB